MKNIVCFGDSNTWGCPPFLDTTSPPERFPKNQRWTSVLASELGSDKIDVVADGLSGRTTVFDDPVEGNHKNGLRSLLACMEAHSPFDLFIIMLGSNDFKVLYNASAFTSARGMLTLIQQFKGYYSLSDSCPEVLIVTPPAIAEAAEPAFWGDAWRRCQGHADYLAQVAERTGCFHFDANRVVHAGSDGVHLDVAGHQTLGRALAREAGAILALRDIR